MSSAERFVRHHRRQTDRAISQAYARLATDAAASATFHELLHCARNRARRLLDAPVVNGHHPGVDALANLSRFTRAHIRAAADWPGTPASWRPAVCSLAQHLVGGYPVPAFLAAAWHATDDAYAEKKREWFVSHARGASFRSLDLPIDMTRKMEHIFLTSPAHLAIEHPKRFNQARRPKYLFSGLTKCAECGGGYVMYWRDRLACFGARSRGTCTNRLTISRQEVEERVLVALREKLMRRDLFEDFCGEYLRELNRLRMEHRAGLSSARSELASVEREIRKLVQAIKDGVSALSVKDELLSLEARKAELQSRLDSPEMPELLHPRMADVYREKVKNLCGALEAEESRTGAADAIRALVEAILLEPDGDQLKITLKGDLAGMLNAARDSKRSPDTGDLLVQIKLVAGARNPLNLEFAWTAA